MIEFLYEFSVVVAAALVLCSYVYSIVVLSEIGVTLEAIKKNKKRFLKAILAPGCAAALGFTFMCYALGVAFW
jgi:hypothetical protein